MEPQIKPLGFFLLWISLDATITRAEPQPSGSFWVDSSHSLNSILMEVEPGAKVFLAPGNYEDILIEDLSGSGEKPIFFVAANRTAPPRIEAMTVRRASHLVFQGITFDYAASVYNRPDHRPFQVLESHDVAFERIRFKGDLTRNIFEKSLSPTGYGLTIRDSRQITVKNSFFEEFRRAVEILNCTRIHLLQNEFSNLRMDAVTFSKVNDLLIERNSIIQFIRVPDSSDHADMIQSWTAGTSEPSQNITIRENLLNSGDGWFTQSIFMRNEEVDTGRAGKEMYYRNVLIEGNVIINAHLHGITVGETDGLIIRNNSVIRNSRSEGPDNNPTLWTPQIRVSPAANNVTISGNVTSKIEGFADQPDWRVQDNFFIQDREPEKPGYYDQVFVGARTGDPNQLENFAPLPGGPLDGKDFGSPILAGLGKNLSTPLPVIKVKRDPSFPNRFAFDAELTRFPAQSDPATAIYSWDMGDGTRLEGPKVTHDYASVGTYDITFSITLPGLDPEQSATTVTIPKSDVLTFDPNRNAIIAGAGEVPLAITDPSITDGVIRLVKAQKPITVPSSLIAPLFGSRDFTLSFRLRGSGDYRNPGDILHIPKTLVVSVTGRGALNVDILGSDGQTRNVKSPGERLYDANWRDVEIAFSGREKTISIRIDGETVAERPFIGLPSTSKWDLIFGHLKQDASTFVGDLSDFRLMVNTEGISAN